ncbi:hypothetical protein ACUBUE_05310 [Staphylococcus aureus]
MPTTFGGEPKILAEKHHF